MRLSAAREGYGVVTTALALFMALCLLFGCAPCAEAADTDSRRVVRVGCFESFGAFFDKDEASGKVTGYAYDYLNAILPYTGWRYEYVNGGWRQLFDMLRRGEIDIMGDISYTSERSSEIFYPDYPMGIESYYIYAIRGRGADTSLEGRRIGVGASTVQSKMLKDYIARSGVKCTIVYFDSDSDRLRLIKEKRIDAFALVDSIKYLDKSYVPLVKIGESNYYLAVNRKRPELLRDLNAALSDIFAADPYFNMELHRKYFSKTVVRQAFSADESKWTAKHGKIVIGYCDDYLPYSDYDEEKRAPAGLLASLVAMLSDRAGIAVDCVAFKSADEMKKALTKGRIDAIFPVYGERWISEQEGRAQSSSFYTDGMSVVYRGDYARLKDGTVAVAASDPIQEDYLRCRHPKARKVLFNSIEDCLRAVDSGRCDAMYASTGVIYRHMNAGAGSSALQVMSEQNEAEFCFGLARGNSALYSIFNKSLARLSDSEVAEAVTPNTIVVPQYTFLDFIRHNSLAVIIALLLFAGLIVALFAYEGIRTKRGRVRLQGAVDAATKANSAKSEFLARMSHEIRTPLNGVLGLTRLALEEDNFETVKDYLGNIDVSGRHLSSLLSNLLDMAKIESGEIELHPEVYTFEEFVRNLHAIVQPLCDQKHIRFIIEAEKDHVPVMLDKTRFNQIVLNITTNSVKFTPEGGEIRLIHKNSRIDETHLSYDLVISDNGAGMTEEFQRHMFDPFAQEHGQQFGSAQGVGLGLTIARAFVELMGGTLEVKSRVGKGTTFHIHMTVTTAAPERAAACEAANAQLDFTGRKILVAEDHPLNQKIVAKLLKKRGAEVIIAENGKKAAELFKESPAGAISAILMDIRMPVMDGLASARAIRAMERPDAAAVPIIAMTANAFDEDKRLSVEAGMNYHLSKPIDPDRLYEVLASLMG